MTAERLDALLAGAERARAAKREQDREDWVAYRTFLREDAQRTRTIADAVADGERPERIAFMRAEQAAGWRTMPRIPRGPEHREVVAA